MGGEGALIVDVDVIIVGVELAPKNIAGIGGFKVELQPVNSRDGVGVNIAQLQHGSAGAVRRVSVGAGIGIREKGVVVDGVNETSVIGKLNRRVFESMTSSAV